MLECLNLKTQCSFSLIILILLLVIVVIFEFSVIPFSGKFRKKMSTHKSVELQEARKNLSFEEIFTSIKCCKNLKLAKR